MQTFLPYPDFARCASVLDGKRLRKQIVECYQIAQALQNGGAWAKHPAVAMWRGYDSALAAYAMAMQDETRRRGWISNFRFYATMPVALPPWLGHSLLHLSHRANLMRKDCIHYGKFLGAVKPAEGYWWPIPCGPTSRKHTAMWEAS